MNGWCFGVGKLEYAVSSGCFDDLYASFYAPNWRKTIPFFPALLTVSFPY